MVLRRNNPGWVTSRLIKEETTEKEGARVRDPFHPLSLGSQLVLNRIKGDVKFG